MALCALSDIPDGGAKGMEIGVGPQRLDLILLRDGNAVRAFRNACPHQGTPLETFPDRFLDATGQFLVCTTHGARFRVSDGVCVHGPCQGAALKRVPVRVAGGKVFLDEQA